MKIKLKNILMISFLAVAGIFGISSAVINNQVKETPVVEKADAAESAPSAVNGKYVYFTDNYSWGGTINVYFTTTSGSGGPSWPGNAMVGLYKDGDNKIVYYSVVPDDTNLLIFNSNGSKQTVDIKNFTLDNTNGWYITGSDTGNRNVGTWKYAGSATGLLSGEKVYIYVGGKQGETIQDGSGYAIYFFNKPSGWGSASEEYWSALATRVVDSNPTFNLGKDGGNNDISLYEVTVPGTNRQFSYMIPTRYDSSKTPSSDKWGGVYNQTYDDIYLVDNTFKTVHLTYYWTDGSNKMSYDATNDYYESKVYSNIFGYHVMNQTTGTCKSDGSTNTTTLASKWNTLRSEYNGYSNVIQYAIWEAVASEAGSDYLSKGTARYDYIALHKYPSLIGDNTDFINRKASPGKAYSVYRGFSPFAVFCSEDNFSTIIIIISSSVALLSVTALSILVIRKRKAKED